MIVIKKKSRVYMGICSEKPAGMEGSSLAPEYQQKADKLIVPKKLLVYGNFFDSDTRTIVTLLNISGVEYTFEEVNIFTG